MKVPVDQQAVEQLARRMYEETLLRLDDSRLRRVVEHKITVMYGPPLVRPDLALVSFQGGGGDLSPSARSWPKKLLYLDDAFSFGCNLRSQFASAGMLETLEQRTVAMAACFPEAPSCEADRWMRKTGTKADWRKFSVTWVKRMLAAMSPRVILVFGKKASQAMGMEDEWCQEERDSRGWRSFGHAEVEGCPALYCQHLSQGWKTEYVQMSIREAGRLISGRGRG